MLPSTAMRRNQRRERLTGPPTAWWGAAATGPCATCCATLRVSCAFRKSVGSTGGVPRPEQVHAGPTERRAEDREDEVGREEAAEQRDQPVPSVGAPAPLD